MEWIIVYLIGFAVLEIILALYWFLKFGADYWLDGVLWASLGGLLWPVLVIPMACGIIAKALYSLYKKHKEQRNEKEDHVRSGQGAPRTPRP